MVPRRDRAGALATALLLLPLVGAGPTTPEGFYPLTIGNRWTYNIERDQTVAPVGKALERLVFRGHMVSEILRNQQQGRRSLQVMRTTTTLWPASGGEERRKREEQHLGWGGGGLVLFADSGDESASAAGRRRPQLRLLDRKLETGHQWPAGTLNLGRVEVPLEALVVGHEDLTIEDDVFEDCLRVRYEGNADGWIDSSDGPALVGWGRYQQEVWYARGVGVVQYIYRMRGEMILPGNTLARFEEVERRRLQTHVLR